MSTHVIASRAPSGTPPVAPALDLTALRAQFPALLQQVHGKPLAYLDNAATTQKPLVVINALKHYYENDNANVHRGVHALSERATAAYERSEERRVGKECRSRWSADH